MSRWPIIIITAAALFFRLYQVNYPPLLWDEASLGYNAYSILKTGKDEYGQILPLVFKSFGDYKPGLYVYLTVPFVAVFGLNQLAVRLPSIILGSLLPLLLYLLITTLSPKSKKVAIYSSLLLAFNPWNIHFSRGAWETNVLLFELVLGSLFFVKQKYIWSSIIFGLTLYTYQGGKIMTPLILSILVLINFPHFRKWQNIIKLGLPIAILSIPILVGLMTKNDANRLNVFALWNYHRPTSDLQQLRGESSDLNVELFHNESIFFVQNFLTRYFNHFSPKFLLFEGDWQIQRHSAPYFGVLLYPSIIFLLIGIVTSLISKQAPLTNLFFLWLLIGPLPGALTRDIIQPVRTLSLSIPLMFFTATGLVHVLNIVPKSFKNLFYTIICIAYIGSFYYYSDLYLNHMTKINPQHWLFGHESAMRYVLDHQNDKKVTFTDFYGQPYIYYLFYSQYPPQKYQGQATLVSEGIDTGKVAKIDNLRFEVPVFNSLKNQPKQLMVFSYDDAVRQGIDLKLLTPLSPINNTSTFYAYETN